MCRRLEVEVCRDGEVANGCFFSCQQPDPAGQSNNESVLAFISSVCPQRPPSFSLSPAPLPLLALPHGQASWYMSGLSAGNSSNTGHLSTPLCCSITHDPLSSAPVILNCTVSVSPLAPCLVKDLTSGIKFV